MEENLDFLKLGEISLNTVDELHSLFPHWKRASVQKKIAATQAGKDFRFVALKDGKIIGHVRVLFAKGLHKHRVEFTSLIVHPKHRHHGVAALLMKFALDSLPKTKSLAILAVGVKNKPAIE
ncbi:MAG: GNAT family N-acetyltransferase, partial [archaeon]